MQDMVIDTGHPRSSAFIRGLIMFLVFACTSHAQDSWFSRSDKAKSDQPHWMTPLVTITPRLEQEFRTDLLIQQTAAGHDLVNFANGKGLELIPGEPEELGVNVRRHVRQDNREVHDRCGDLTFLGK